MKSSSLSRRKYKMYYIAISQPISIIISSNNNAVSCAKRRGIDVSCPGETAVCDVAALFFFSIPGASRSSQFQEQSGQGNPEPPHVVARQLIQPGPAQSSAEVQGPTEAHQLRRLLRKSSWRRKSTRQYKTKTAHTRCCTGP